MTACLVTTSLGTMTTYLVVTKCAVPACHVATNLCSAILPRGNQPVQCQLATWQPTCAVPACHVATTVTCAVPACHVATTVTCAVTGCHVTTNLCNDSFSIVNQPVQRQLVTWQLTYAMTACHVATNLCNDSLLRGS